jgi:hypothetical protein
MKKILVLIAILASSLAFAVSDLSAAINSTKTLIAAINADASRPGYEDMQYLPGYGLVTLSETLGAFGGNTDKIVIITKALTSALAPTLKGLEAGDWLSFNIRYGFSDSYTHVTLRAKYGDLTSSSATAWELWVNGKKQ